jgi:phosphate starvation-inducible PhoH-like protein
MACQYLEERKVERIILTRPMVQSGRETIGFLKGDLKEKVLPFLLPLIEHLNHFMGKEIVQQMIANDIITLVPLELARGMNFYRSFVVIDEAQNCTYDQIKMLLTRLCKGSKMVMNGDVGQCDIGECDFMQVIDRLEGMRNLEIVQLDKRDIMRSGDIAEILKRLE